MVPPCSGTGACTGSVQLGRHVSYRSRCCAGLCRGHPMVPPRSGTGGCTSLRRIAAIGRLMRMRRNAELMSRGRCLAARRAPAAAGGWLGALWSSGSSRVNDAATHFNIYSIFYSIRVFSRSSQQATSPGSEGVSCRLTELMRAVLCGCKRFLAPTFDKTAPCVRLGLEKMPSRT